MHPALIVILSILGAFVVWWGGGRAAWVVQS
jgi:hypothetical protein